MVEIPEEASHLLAIGTTCSSWNALEKALDVTLRGFLQLGSLELAKAVTHNIDFRDKIRMALAVGYQFRPSEDWFARYKAVLDNIDNNLRPERNRIIHDTWTFDEGALIRWQRKTRAYRPQARELAVKLDEKTPYNVRDIYLTCQEMADASIALLRCTLETGPWRKEPRLSLGQSLLHQLEAHRPVVPDDVTQ